MIWIVRTKVTKWNSEIKYRIKGFSLISVWSKSTPPKVLQVCVNRNQMCDFKAQPLIASNVFIITKRVTSFLLCSELCSELCERSAFPGLQVRFTEVKAGGILREVFGIAALSRALFTNWLHIIDTIRRLCWSAIVPCSVTQASDDGSSAPIQSVLHSWETTALVRAECSLFYLWY